MDEVGIIKEDAIVIVLVINVSGYIIVTFQHYGTSEYIETYKIHVFLVRVLVSLQGLHFTWDFQ